MNVILDPTSESVPVTRQLTPRSGALSGRVSLLDIAKPRGNVLLDRVETLLRERHPGIEVQRFSKPTFTKPAPDALRQEVRAVSDFVIEGLAD
ncbi:MAG: hypothetical protein H6993_15835 [Pseudomonadales bacterium]|nr:hypothetical protein [Pseudomonadales bacterium]MCP5185434.1 hypothetical protein [Pseudomonadales bacterium]